MSRKKATDKEYWEEKLRKAGLSMDAGRDPGHRKLVLIGGSIEVDMIQEIMIRKKSGRVRPKGAGPDDGSKE